ncbi:MAG: hypothetical protein QOH48_2285 [Actinomycetota bacterium]|jgi:uncharacterized damage-inducible protein DinB|nr:hypothetical protein [Actinomycetota bacterium]
MTLDQDVPPPSDSTDERTMLVAFLDYLRARMIAKLDGLDDEQAKRSLVPSGTSLLGLIKHLAIVELGWFVWSFEGSDLHVTPDVQEVSPEDTISGVVDLYRSAVARSQAVVASNTELDQKAARSRRPNRPTQSMRWILVHMIEETARHAGHADILREQIDGTTGR